MAYQKRLINYHGLFSAHYGIILGLLFVALAALPCIGQKQGDSLACDLRVEIQYDKKTKGDRKSNLIEKSNTNSFIVKFMNEFKDSIAVYVNGKLKFSDFVSTDRVTLESSSVFGVNYGQSNEKVTLRIRSLTRNICCIVDVDTKYKIVYVFMKSPDHWIVRFSNVHYIH